MVCAKNASILTLVNIMVMVGVRHVMVNGFQFQFTKWSSENVNIDKLIQRTQLKAKRYKEVLKWIEYDRFYNIEYLAKGGFGTTYKATWKDGPIWYWDSENNQ